jgi:chemotaxis protein MotB
MIRSLFLPVAVVASLFTTGCSNLQTEYEKQAGIISDQKRIMTELSQTNEHLKAEAVRLQTELQKASVRSQFHNNIDDLNKGYSQKLQAMIQSINTQLDASLNNIEGVSKHPTPEGTMIRLEEKILFRSGSADLSASGKSILQKVADVLKNHPNQKIRVDGHSDSDRINKSKKKFSSNWDLSATRAVRVAEALDASGIEGRRVTVAGYSMHQPVDPSNKKANRRVEILILNQ